MDFLQMLIVLVVAAAVIYGVQIIIVKIFVGDADAAINGGGSFNPKSSLNKMLNQKMEYFSRLSPLSVRWLVFYSNILLPALSVLGVWSSISQSLKDGFVPNAGFFLYLAFAGSCFFTSILIRLIDRLSFYINFLPSIALLAYIIVSAGGFIVLSLVIYVPIIALNAWYFIRRRELFLLDLRQMKQKVEEIDVQNAS